ncbi:MAG: proline dehydrogenase family protein [Gemmatimonadaceae bacterium]|nr:proline dehydrogenase family protein [Gemmatimonadaceae bacterium]
MLRSTLIWLSRQKSIFRFVRNNGFAKSMASRFVAGETLEAACDAVAVLNTRGITASLDQLGESVTSEAEAREVGRRYLQLLDEINRRGLNANVSVKLTSLGQDISDALCEEITRAILERAKQYGTFVRLDMEGSDYTQRTLDFFAQRLYPEYSAHVGIVLQSMLRRTAQDVAWANEKHCRVRICKGAYLEPATVAFPDKKDVDRNYVECAKALIQHGNYPGIATHDPAIITELNAWVNANGISRDRFEYQMLYGVRRDLQDQLIKDGYRLRLYVPFGTQWYPYLMRRMAERPANLWFITGNILKETFRAK